MIVFLNVVMALSGFVGSAVALCYKTLDEENRKLTKPGWVAGVCLTVTLAAVVAKETIDWRNDRIAEQEKRELVSEVTQMSSNLTKAGESVAAMAKEVGKANSSLANMAKQLTHSSDENLRLLTLNQRLNQQLLQHVEDVPTSVKAVLGLGKPVQHGPTSFQKKLQEYARSVYENYEVKQFQLIRAKDNLPVVLEGIEKIEYSIRYSQNRALHQLNEIRERVIWYEEQISREFDRRKFPLGELIVGDLRYPLLDFNGTIQLENHSRASIHRVSKPITNAKLEMIGEHADWTVVLTIHTLPSTPTGGN